jgi:hypothetical protein
MDPTGQRADRDLQAAGLAATRRSLHGVAELVMAGPQFRRSRSIQLRVVPGGFGTVAEPAPNPSWLGICGCSGHGRSFPRDAAAGMALLCIRGLITGIQVEPGPDDLAAPAGHACAAAVGERLDDL